MVALHTAATRGGPSGPSRFSVPLHAYEPDATRTMCGEALTGMFPTELDWTARPLDVETCPLCLATSLEPRSSDEQVAPAPVQS
jgi:hypothetical protein